MMNFRKKRGFALAETLLALAILSISSVTALYLIQSATNTTRLARDFLIAEGLATEGLEGVKNIRNTNWLNKSSNTCWLTIDPDTTVIAEADCLDVGNQANTSQNYQVAKQDSGGFKLLEKTGELNLGDGTADTQYLLYLDSNFTPTRYVALPGGPGGLQDPSRFYRSITIDEDGSDNVDATYTVKVQWMQGKRVQTLSRSTTIYNY